MTELWIALIGVGGTLGAVIVTSFAQRGVLKHQQEKSELAARRAAMSDFAAKLMEYRSARLAAWFEAEQSVRDGEDRKRAMDLVSRADKVRECRTEAWAAYTRLRLHWADRTFINKAEALLDAVKNFEDESDRDELRTAGQNVQREVGLLIDWVREDGQVLLSNNSATTGRAPESRVDSRDSAGL